MNSRNRVALLAYVAAPHGGYLSLFRKYSGSSLYVFGEDLIAEFAPLTRHLPGVRPDEAVAMIKALDMFSSVRTVNAKDLDLAFLSPLPIVMPDEDVSRAVAERHLQGISVTFDPSWKLRWDLNATTHHKQPEGEMYVSEDEADRMFMQMASQTARRSPDWWRQVGGVLAHDGTALLTAYNTHLPSEQSAYVCGDPRSNFEPGVSIDMSVALHAEIGLLTEAARRGIQTEGCDMYVTTFPCPPCANACANSGIRRLYYRDGYSLVAGAEALRSRGVELYRVQ